MADLKEFITTHKTWTVLWALVAIFWLVGFGYSCSQLAHSKIYDGRPFFAELFGPQPPPKSHPDDDDDKTYEEIKNRNFPAWLICPGLPSEGFVSSDINASCSQCILARGTGGCLSTIDVPAQFEANYTNCYVFNGPYPSGIVTVPSNQSVINCEITLTNTSRARFYVFDQNWLADRDHQWLFPDGIVQRTFPLKTRNLVELSRSKYIFTRGHHETVSFYSYQMLDGESYPRTDAKDDAVTLTLFYGAPSEWRYTQYPYGKVKSGFGFYSWISFLGGLSFFCYFFQVAVYALICKAMGWENDTAGNYQNVN